MKAAGLLLPLLIAVHTPAVRAEEPAQAPATVPAEEAKSDNPPPSPPPPSASVLPKDAPPAAAPVEAKPAASNPDVLELPKVTVTQKPRPRLKLTDEVIMTSKGFNEKLAKENLSSFDRNFLNKFTLPLFGQSAEARAREEYERKKREELKQDVLDLAKVAEVVDPAQAKAMRDAINRP